MRLSEICDKNKILYHATALSSERVVYGLDANRSRSAQPAIYLSNDPSLAMMTAENTQNTTNLTLVAILVDKNVKLHPDEDIFLYPESTPDLAYFNQLFSSDYYKTPSEILYDLEAGKLTAEQAPKLLTVNIDKLNRGGIINNVAYYGLIGQSGLPRIIEAAEYKLVNDNWIINKNTTNRYLPQIIKRY